MQVQDTTGLLEGYLRRNEMAKQLGVSQRTLARWEARRIGPPRVVIGRQIFYRLASVFAWLESKEAKQKRR
jgi:predicted DNA-binding transcriptional regulator AlpA